MSHPRLLTVFLLFTFVLTTSPMLGVEANAQPSGDVQLSIVGLMKAKRVAVLDLVSAELTTVQGDASRRGSNVSGQVYNVVRFADRRSETIRASAESGKVFRRAQIKFDGVDGEIVEELGKVYITNYTRSASSGDAPTESFTVVFESASAEG